MRDNRRANTNRAFVSRTSPVNGLLPLYPQKKPPEIGRLFNTFARRAAAQERLWMILMIGRNRAMTIVPTTTAMNTIMTGSMIDVRPATELSTSSS